MKESTLKVIEEIQRLDFMNQELEGDVAELQDEIEELQAYIDMLEFKFL